MRLTSSAFVDEAEFPAKYTCDGNDSTPPLAVAEAPEGTRSFALICHDPDAPRGNWVHWVLYNWPAETPRLPESIPPQRTLENGARQGVNTGREIGYGGPCPPPGPAHRYIFTIYALDAQLDLPGDVTESQLRKAMEGHTLAEAQLMGRYGR